MTDDTKRECPHDTPEGFSCRNCLEDELADLQKISEDQYNALGENLDTMREQSDEVERLTDEVAALRAERGKWKSAAVRNGNDALEAVRESRKLAAKVERMQSVVDNAVEYFKALRFEDHEPYNLEAAVDAYREANDG